MQEVRSWEKHLGAITQAIIVALLLWTGNSMIQLRETVAVMEIKISMLQNEFGKASNQNYSMRDAVRDMTQSANERNRLEERITRLEQAMGFNGARK